MNDNKNSMKGTAVPTFEYKADAATPCLTLIPAPVTLEYTHGTAMIGSLVTIEKRIPEYAVTEDADETAANRAAVQRTRALLRRRRPYAPSTHSHR